MVRKVPSFSFGVFEALEPRFVLAIVGGVDAYFPEGYASDAVSEFVPIANHNEESIRYELHARYEFGERDQLLEEGTIAAHSRGGVTVSAAGDDALTLVRKDVPYALVLRTTLPVAASLTHLDFGSGVGESFTSTTDTDWAFANIRKESAIRDFILIYNPGLTQVVATLTLVRENAAPIVLNLPVAGQRRAGWAINELAQVPDGVYAAMVTATSPIVASQSQYEINEGRGFGVLGTTGGGTRAGVLNTFHIDDDDDIFEEEVEAHFAVFNPNDAPAEITFSFVPDDEARAPIVRTVSIPANSRMDVSIDSLDFEEDEKFAAAFRSTLPVTVAGVEVESEESEGVQAATMSATRWEFAEGFMSQSRAGSGITEQLLLFNPTDQAMDVTVRFAFLNGDTVTMIEHLEALEVDDISIHEIPQVRDRGETNYYGISASSPTSFVATFEHRDDAAGEEIASIGVPRGTITPLTVSLDL